MTASTASHLARSLRRLLPFTLSLAVLPALALFASPALAAGGFGVESGSFRAGTFTAEGVTGLLNEGVTPDVQAGRHPYEQTVTFKLNTLTNSHGQAYPAGGDAKNAVVNLPAGFAGNPNATPYCSAAVLQHDHTCPHDTVIGVARVYFDVPNSENVLIDVLPAFVPVYNVAPSRGELALFGFFVGRDINLVTLIHVRVRSTGDYGLTATVTDISQVSEVIESAVTLWGVPADHGHDPLRGSHDNGGGCLSELEENGKVSTGSCPSDTPPRPFLTNPTECGGQPLTSTLNIDSWQNPGLLTASDEPVLSDPNWLTATAGSPPLEGCERLVFNPSLSVTPETSAVDSPTGLNVDVHVPQSEDPSALATPDLRNATVALPAGVAISPAAANGLAGCTPEGIGLHTENPVACPDASKLSTVRVTSPDLPRDADGSEGALTGFVYLGAPASGPITAPPYTIYLLAEGYGVSIRLQGSVSPNPATGQLTATFTENPQLPFDDLKLDFFGGPRAALATPPACGGYTTTSQLVPYSSPVAATPSSSFQASFDGNGAACPNPLSFAPAFSAGSTNTTAGGFGSFVLNISRPDGQQALSQITLTTPPGLSGMLSSVPLCGEPQAAQGTCPSSSQIGTATAGAGAGPEPFYASGPVSLTGPYKGAPFGLSVAIPAVAGPFNFGTVVVRSAIYVDPHTAQITVVSDPLPQMVDTSQTDSGVPVALHSVSVNIDRPGFIFNPTSCDPMTVNGTLSSNQGASVAESSPFQVGGCGALAFKPSFAVSTQAKTSKANGASLDVKVASGPGQANIAKVDVSLPLALPSRLTTLQKACTEVQFAANPSGCPAGSVVGVATAVTPVLNVPLTGPAYLVSHGGAAFPDLVVVLQGQGVTIELTGETDIKKGVTYSKFETVPDAPVSTFELKLPEGPHSILGAYLPASAKGSFCGENLSMPRTITAQNGAVVKQDTAITVSGCPPAVKVIKTQAKAKSLLVTIDTTVKGTITLSGRGVHTTTEKNVRAGESRITVRLTSTGQAMRARRARLELRASLTTGRQAVAKTASVKL
jgi:hypothetical protein